MKMDSQLVVIKKRDIVNSCKQNPHLDEQTLRKILVPIIAEIIKNEYKKNPPR